MATGETKSVGTSNFEQRHHKYRFPFDHALDPEHTRQHSIVIASLCGLFCAALSGLVVSGLVFDQRVDLSRLGVSQTFVLYASVLSMFYIPLHQWAASKGDDLYPSLSSLSQHSTRFQHPLHGSTLSLARGTALTWGIALVATSVVVVNATESGGSTNIVRADMFVAAMGFLGASMLEVILECASRPFDLPSRGLLAILSRRHEMVCHDPATTSSRPTLEPIRVSRIDLDGIAPNPTLSPSRSYGPRPPAPKGPRPPHVISGSRIRSSTASVNRRNEVAYTESSAAKGHGAQHHADNTHMRQASAASSDKLVYEVPGQYPDLPYPTHEELPRPPAAKRPQSHQRNHRQPYTCAQPNPPNAGGTASSPSKVPSTPPATMRYWLARPPMAAAAAPPFMIKSADGKRTVTPTRNGGVEWHDIAVGQGSGERPMVGAFPDLANG